MNTWKKVMISALCVLAAGVVGFVGLLVYVSYEEKHQRDYEETPIRLSADIVMEYGWNGRREYARLKNIRTGKYTTPKLQHIFIPTYDGSDSMAVFRTYGGKRGYLNICTGKIVIPARYDRAWNFSEGIAAVYKDGAVSFITPTGEAAFEQIFPTPYSDYYSSIAPVFHGGLCAIRTPENKWGLINSAGEWAVEPLYNSIDTPTYGYRKVFDGKKYGLLNTDGSIALPTEYDEIRMTSGCPGFVLVKDGLGKEVDVNFKTTIPFVFDAIHFLGYGYYRYDLGENSGVVDARGNVIVPAIYYNFDMWNERVFEVTKTPWGERFLMDVNGRFVGGIAP